MKLMAHQPLSPFLVLRAKTALAFLSLLAVFSLRPEAAAGEVAASVNAGPPSASILDGSMAQADSAAQDDAAALTTSETAALPAGRTPEASERPVVMVSHRKMFAAVPFVEELLTVEAYNELQDLIIQTNKPAIVMLYSAWCHHCFIYKKTFSLLAEDLHEKFHFAALNCMESSDLHQLCIGLKVIAFPFIKLFVPASIHLKLPEDQQQVKVHDPSSQYVLYDIHKLKLGGFLNSFDAASQRPLAIHTLALPADDIFLAMAYAGKQTLQDLSTLDLPKTLGSSVLALEPLRGKPCEASRWPSEEVASEQEPKTETKDERKKNIADDRVHDAIRGLQFFLASWVATPSDELSRADVFSLIDFLEVVRAAVSPKEIKRAATLAILHLYRKGNLNKIEQKLSVILNAVNAGFKDQFEVYRHLDQDLQETTGMKAASFRDFIGRVSFGSEFPPLPPLVDPELRHCKSTTCSVWMLLHFLAEGSSALANLIIEHPGCGIDKVFYKRKAQALPIFLLRQQEATGTKADDAEILRISAMSTDELIEYDGKLGCGIIPAFDVAYYTYNVLRRFFSCSECREHFRIQFEHQTHGLSVLLPPEGEYILSSPDVLVAADEQSLLEQYRSQPESDAGSWNVRREENRKLNKLRLWLWRLHNAVNVRTAADSTLAFVKGDEAAKSYLNCDVRWPPQSACKACRFPRVPPKARVSVDLLASRDDNKDIFAIEEETSDFYESQLQAYLKESYWPTSFQRTE